jgi:hypothetical protein
MNLQSGNNAPQLTVSPPVGRRYSLFTFGKQPEEQMSLQAGILSAWVLWVRTGGTSLVPLHFRSMNYQLASAVQT